MECLSSGRLLPWLGPAIRGVVARAFKDRVCRFAEPPKTCRNCSFSLDCPYGLTFESELPPNRSAPSGMSDSQRAISIRPPFPVAESARPGDKFSLCITLLGERAAAAAVALGEILENPRSAFALGSERVIVRFYRSHVPEDEHTLVHELRAEDLPPSSADCRGQVSSLQLDLISPLFLKEEAARGHKARPVLQPTLGHLVRASLRTVGRAFASFGDGPLEGRVDFAALKALAERIPTQKPFWEPFRQGHRSNRREQCYDLVGTNGGAIFAAVPLCLIPWLIWGGQFGVGEHRVAGAGCWKIKLSA